MDFTPLWESHWLVVAHALTAMGAIAIGCVQMVSTKGTLSHKRIGRVWVAVMAIVALSSFGIHQFRVFGPFSPIHLLSALTLYTLWSAVSSIRNGDVKKHKKDMIILYVLALLITGAFTLLPGRVMYQVFFG